MTREDLDTLVKELRYELTQAKHRRGWKYPPISSGIPVHPAIVTVEIPPAAGDGSFVFGGKAKLITDNLGTQAAEEINVWNKYQARIPVDVVIDVDKLPGTFDLLEDYQLIAADCDPAGPELLVGQSTTSSLISEVTYTPITPAVTIDRPGIYDARFNIQLTATIPNNATLAYQLQLWDATNSVEIANTGPIGQTRASSGVVADNGAIFGNLDTITGPTDIVLRALDVGDGTLESTIG